MEELVMTKETQLRYIAASEKTLEGLCVRVSNEMENGFIPVGSVIIRGDESFTQMLYKPKERATPKSQQAQPAIDTPTFREVNGQIVTKVVETVKGPKTVVQLTNNSWIDYEG